MIERPDYRTALAGTSILSRLVAFDPRVVGTPPLGLAVASSDIDVRCHAPDRLCLANVVWEAFSGASSFSMHQWRDGDRPVVATFRAYGWTFEIFASPRPVDQQAGWRHFEVEQRLLLLGGQRFRSTVMGYRTAGMKTEPAFAAALQLKGDPYKTLLDLEILGDDRLQAMLQCTGFGV